MLISEILPQLRPVEEQARDVYRALGEHCAGDPDLSKFFRLLAQDEEAHAQLLRQAERLFQETGGDGEVAILVDPEAGPRASTAGLNELMAVVRSGRPAVPDLLRAIVRFERSEWNDLFLYVIARFREREPSFQHIAAVIQQHKRRIEDYLATRPESERLADGLQPLPTVWSERVLVVDDDDAMGVLLQEYLGSFAEVTVAANGQEALARIRERFFDAIVTDIDMPVMDGMEFYRQATGGTSAERRRFIFMTGHRRPELEDLSVRDGVSVLPKPFRLEALRQAVRAVLARNP